MGKQENLNHLLFIKDLKELCRTTQANLKRCLNEEIQLKSIQAAVNDAFQDLMSTVEGQNKKALNEEIRTMATAQADIKQIKDLKETVQGIMKNKVQDELLSEPIAEKINRLVSKDIRNVVDKMQTEIDG